MTLGPSKTPLASACTQGKKCVKGTYGTSMTTDNAKTPIAGTCFCEESHFSYIRSMVPAMGTQVGQ